MCNVQSAGNLHNLIGSLCRENSSLKLLLLNALKMSEKTPVKVYPKTINVCRLCSDSKNPDRFTHIFNKAGDNKELSNKIINTLGIEIEEEDGFPASICRSCEKKLNDYHNFKVSVINTQIHLKQQVKVKRCRKPSSPTTDLPKEKAAAVERLASTKSRCSLFPSTAVSSTVTHQQDESTSGNTNVSLYSLYL